MLIKNIYSRNDILTKIIHLSDIHIRTGNREQSRFDEYIQVIDRLLKNIECIVNQCKNEESNELHLCVVTGDIFHNKLKIEACGIDLFMKLMNGLSNLIPTIIIRGNHDIKQQDISKINHENNYTSFDLIKSLLQERGFSNIHYFDKSGMYVVGDTLFGLVDIVDALEFGSASGTSTDLIEFPDPTKMDFIKECGFIPQKRIALFHGSIVSSKLPSGLQINNTGYSLEWICGKNQDKYDLVLLGDVHLQQIHGFDDKTMDYLPKYQKMIEINPNLFIVSNNGLDEQRIKENQLSNYKNEEKNKKQLWGYAGSLVQQDFGEPLLGHGFLLWSFKESKITVNTFHVKNEYGNITLSPKTIFKEGVSSISWYLSESKNNLHNILLEDALNCAWFPKTKLNIRLKMRSDSEFDEHLQFHISKLNDFLTRKGIKFDISTLYEYDNDNKPIQTNTDLLDSGNNLNNDCILNITSDENWINYVKSTNYENELFDWTLLFSNRDSIKVQFDEEWTEMLDSYTLSKIKDRNEKIQKKMDIFDVSVMSDVNDKTICNSKEIRLLKLDWDWVLCFGAGNEFDFTRKLNKSLALISAKNGYGKSNFLETICIALYGEGFPSKDHKEFNNMYIVNQCILDRKPTPLAKTKIVFEVIDSIENTKTFFKIYREFNILKDKKVGNKVQEIYYYSSNEESDLEIDNGDQWTKLYSGKLAVENWVNTNIGTSSNFLMTTMFTQSCDKDFFLMKCKDQREFIDTMFNVDQLSSYIDIFKESQLAHNCILDCLNVKIDSAQKELNILNTYITDNIDIVKHFEDEKNLLSTKVQENTQRKDYIEIEMSKCTSDIEKCLWIEDWKEYFSIENTCEHTNNHVINNININYNDVLSGILTNSSSDIEILSLSNLKDVLFVLKKHGVASIREILHKLNKIKVDISGNNIRSEELKQKKEYYTNIINKYGLSPTNNVKNNNICLETSIVKNYNDDDDIMCRLIDEIDSSDKYIEVKNKRDELLKMFKIVDEYEKNKEKYKEFWKLTEKQLKSKLNKCIKDDNKLQKDITKHKNLIDSLECELGNYRNLLETENEKLTKEYTNNKPNKPTITNEDIEQYIKETKLNLIDSSVEKEYVEICKDWHQLNSELQQHEIDFSNYEHNPKCWACKKMPWIIRKEEKKLQLETISLKLNNNSILSIDHINNYDLFYRSKLEYLSYINWEEGYKTKCEEVTSIKYSIKNTNDKLNATKIHFIELNKKSEEVCNSILQLKECLIDKRMFNDYDVQGNFSINNIKEEYEKQVYKFEKLEELTTLCHSMLSNVTNKLVKMEKETDELIANKSSLGDCILEIKQKFIYHSEDESVDELLFDLTKFLRNMYKTSRCNLSDLKQERSHLEELISNDHHKLIEINTKKIKYDVNKIRKDEITNNLEMLSKMRTTMSVKYRTLIDLLKLMKDYKSWFYNNRIKYLIEGKTNSIIANINNEDRALKLYMKMKTKSSVDKPQHNVEFDWILKDNMNTLPIETLSGYQKFILSLCFRIAISELLRNKISWRQLFIDEGFTSCDNDNLHKAPIFMKGLINKGGYDKYDTIIIVSHLEHIKDNVDVNVEIMRDNFKGISYLKY